MSGVYPMKAYKPIKGPKLGRTKPLGARIRGPMVGP